MAPILPLQMVTRSRKGAKELRVSRGRGIREEGEQGSSLCVPSHEPIRYRPPAAAG